MSAYTITTTRAFVLERVVSGEKNVRTYLYTRELGRIYVLVQNGASVNSKLAPHIRIGCEIVCDLISTRSGWRLTGVQLVGVYLQDREVLKNIQSLIRRYTNLEQKDEGMYDTYLRAQNTYRLLRSEGWVVDDRAFGAFTTSLILSKLGYFEKPLWYDILDLQKDGAIEGSNQDKSDVAFPRTFCERNNHLFIKMIPQVNKVLHEIQT